MIPKTDNSQITWSVAVYWVKPGDYGSPTEYRNYKDAKDAIQRLFDLGYGKPGLSEVHIIRHHRQIWSHTRTEEKQQA